MISEGIYDDLSNEAYHGDKDSISRSALIEFDKSPFHYWSRYLNPDAPKEEPTQAMIFGAAFHEFVLEPGKFDDNYACKPEPVLLKDVGRDLYDKQKKLIEFLEKSKQTLLTANEYTQLEEMKIALQSHKAYDLIKDAIYEQSYFWKDPHSELMIKCRPDILHSNMIVDLKTCADASPRGFQRAMVDGSYHIQGAMIRDAIRHFHNRDISTVINIAIEKKYPYAIGIYIIDEAALDAGHMKYKQLLLNLKHAIMHKEFPGYEAKTIFLPDWAI